VRAQEGALAASVAKSEFLAVMSHELRTPLNALSGYAALLEEGIFGPVNDGQRGALARMRAARDQLVGLVEQVLDMARVEAGSKEVHREEVELDAVVAGVAGTLAGAAAGKGLALEVDAPPGLRLHTDGWMVRQIVSHLVDNAIKFTARGSVLVRARAGTGGVAVEVADTGQGIAAGYHERIFEPFFQVDASTTRQEGGMGLGLAVAREFARLLGGEVSVRSAPGDGSVFVLSLPG
jgi:signal transduction histidine kinase